MALNNGVQDVSAIGFSIHCKASKTFPSGFLMTAFPDDSDPFDIPAIDIASAAMGPNGDLVTWGAPTPITITINVLPDSQEDQNLAVILEANRAGKGKTRARDVITMVGQYADGSSITLSQGVMTNGMPAKSVSSDARIKTKSYSFTFQTLSQTRSN